MQCNKVYLIPILLFILSFTLRFALISKGNYHVDSLTLTVIAEETLRTKTLHYAQGHGYPLTALLSTLFVSLTKPFSSSGAVFAVNMLGVLFGSLCVPALYMLVRKLLNSEAALISSLLFSLSPVFIGVSTYGNSHSPALFFILGGLYSLILYKETGHIKSLAICILFLGLAGAARLQDAIVMFIPLCVVYWNKKLGNINEVQTLSGNFRKKLLLFMASVAGVSLILVLFYLHPLKVLPKSNVENYYYAGFLQYIPSLFAYFSLGLEFLVYNYSVIGLIVVLFGMLLMLKKHTSLFLFLVLWLAVPYLIFCNAMIFFPRHLTAALPSLYIAQGFFLAKCLELNRAVKIGVILLFGFVSATGFYRIYQQVSFRHQFSLLPDFVASAAEVLEPDSIVITVDNGRFYQYYGNFRTMKRPASMTKDLSDAELEKFKLNVDAILEKGTPLYITWSSLAANYNVDQFHNFMKKNYKLEHTYGGNIEDWHLSIPRLLVVREKIYRVHKN